MFSSNLRTFKKLAVKWENFHYCVKRKVLTNDMMKLMLVRKCAVFENDLFPTDFLKNKIVKFNNFSYKLHIYLLFKYCNQSRKFSPFFIHHLPRQ